MSLPKNEAEGPEPVVAWETAAFSIDPVGLRVVALLTNKGCGME